MSRDVRELILDRIKTVLSGMTGVVSTWRDRADVPSQAEDGSAQLPAAILLDGDEIQGVKTHGHGIMPPTVMILQPEIWIKCMPRDNVDNLTLNDVSNPIAQELSAWRVKVLQAIRRDQSLVSLLGGNGEIEYRGSVTDMKVGSTCEGQICMLFNFQYTLNYDLL